MTNCGRTLGLAAVAAAALALAAPVAAAPPIKEDSPPLEVSFPAGAFCSFGVTIESVQNGLFTITFLDADGNLRWIFGAGQSILRVTNDDSGESIVVNASGPGKIVPQPDGSLLIDGQGPWLFGFFPTDTPSQELVLLTGHFPCWWRPTGR